MSTSGPCPEHVGGGSSSPTAGLGGPRRRRSGPESMPPPTSACEARQGGSRRGLETLFAPLHRAERRDRLAVAPPVTAACGSWSIGRSRAAAAGVLST